ncbi:MAG: tetraacyldisaccharide 4'-kinase [Bacteroidales bacterium]|nr:tetraacyldisaccharide 4'-kinase [Bacteroidales bacterium]
MIYKLILKIRNARYRDGRRSARAAVPTVCVGNITVGGTGKTPHTEMLVRELGACPQWADKHIAVLSRGYKRRSKGFQVLPRDASAGTYGDEPAQIKRKYPDITVAVDKDRVEGCRKLEDAEVIVLDDAYQYRKLKATMDIVLSDYNRPVSTDSLLPSGRLRDLKERLYDCDTVIVTKCPGDLTTEEKREAARILGYGSYDPSNCRVTRGNVSQTLLFTSISYEAPVPLFPNTDSRYTYSKKVILFSGVANDIPLLKHLSDTYKVVSHRHFPDHHKYSLSDMRSLVAEIKRNPTAAVATTEKDAVRLLDVKKMPPQLQERLFYIPIKVRFLSEREHEVFTDKLITL